MQAFKERDEQLALERARALKELKNSIEGPSSPSTGRVMVGAYRSASYDTPIPRPGEGGARFERMKREPLRLSVMTEEGLVPLPVYQDPEYQQELAARRAEEESGGFNPFGGSEIKAWRLSLFDRGDGSGRGGENARAVPLGEGAGENANAQGEEVLAIVEETPSRVEGGEPERKILGFLPVGRSSSAGARAEARQWNERRQGGAGPGNGSPAGQSGAAGNEASLEGDSGESFTAEDVIPYSPETTRSRGLLAKWLNGGGRDDVVMEGEEVVLSMASPDRQKRFYEKWFDRLDSGARGGGAAFEVTTNRQRRERPAAPGAAADCGALDEASYLAVADLQAPFHVIDSGPSETYVVELPQGTVGRNHGSGDHWAWIQLDSGLMGLIRKQHLRSASETEKNGFLVAERSSRGDSGSSTVARGSSEESAEGDTVATPGSSSTAGDSPGTSSASSAAAGSDAPVPPGLMNEPEEKKEKDSKYSETLEDLLKSLE